MRQLQTLADSATPLPYQTPSQTPWAAGPSDTPLRTPVPGGEGGDQGQKRKRYDTEMSLDAFQARYTSEDNASFTQILDDENPVNTSKNTFNPF